MIKLRNLCNTVYKTNFTKTITRSNSNKLFPNIPIRIQLLKPLPKHFSTTRELNEKAINSNPNFKLNSGSVSNTCQSNFASSIFENASHYIKYKEKYLARMEKEKFLSKSEIEELRNSKNFANILFVFKYYTECRTNLLRFVREFYNLYNFLDDKIIVLLLKKIFAQFETAEFEELDKLGQLVLYKGIYDFEVINYLKKFVIIYPHNFTYANIGNLLIHFEHMGFLTKDFHVQKYYSEYLLSGLLKLNYNDIIFAFDGLSKLKNVDAYVWDIVQYFILKKFSKLYRINSLKRLVVLMSDSGVKDTAFWKIVDQYILYNFDKIHQVNITLEIICYIKKNLGYSSINVKHFLRYFNVILSRKDVRDLEILVNSYEYIKDNPDAVSGNNLVNLSTRNQTDNSSKSPNSLVATKSPFLEKLKTALKFIFETQLEDMNIQRIRFLFDKDRDLLKTLNSTLINDKYFALLIEKIDTYTKDWQLKFYFEMGRYDSRFKKYVDNLKIYIKSEKLNSQLNEYNFLLMFKFIKEYENTEEPNTQFFLSNLIKNFNDVLEENLDLKYYELLIALIPYCPTILKHISPEIKKKKLNQVINGFVEYKNQLFIGGQVNKMSETAMKDGVDFQKYIGQGCEIDYDKLIVLKILNNLNPKKLDLQADLLQMINDPKLLKIDISRCYLIKVICMFYNLSMEELEDLYKMKFFDSVYDKFI